MRISKENIRALLSYVVRPDRLGSIFTSIGNDRLLSYITLLWNGITQGSDVPDTSTEPALISVCVNGLESVSRVTTERSVNVFLRGYRM